MTQENLETEFAPADRYPMEIIQKQVRQFLQYDLSCPAMQGLINTMSDLLLVLNDKRQAIFCNDMFLNIVKQSSKNNIYGKRPGELLNCIHASEKNEGCGTTRFCRKCGAVKAILNGLDGKKDIQECRIIQKDSGKAFEFRVYTSSLQTDENLCVMFISDISHEKRRRALERIFFHDILNTINSLNGCIQIISTSGPEEYDEYVDLLERLSAKIIDEINAQKELTAAENNELQVDIQEQSSLSIIHDLQKTCIAYPIAKNRWIDIDPISTDVLFKTDRLIISRVITNLIKNALEATPEKCTISIGCQSQHKEVVFWVHNPSYMPDDVQLQIFQRSFSTKGEDRGLGTYSIKLLTERYLNGRVVFNSKESTGTIFQVFFL
ncbi:MAG: histidine kinase [Candidatus Magnetoglobus multicellularis str. Araruama]|uniref:histidine kinase n=1 Tax=Candidatus Magnetoglobus multicellularis str. Araruama TaxID=890399 RepID=A0A1V1P6V2_9BACT|nr:MAG: histidine kinase [Candidatus Magnetoglobus multicellularis str. Araruama]